MKIAVTYENGKIFQHFGHTEHFKVYDVEDGQVKSSAILDSGETGHGALATLLKDGGVAALICGGIGGGAQNALAQAGITLYAGVTGGADEAVQALLTLSAKGESISEQHVRYVVGLCRSGQSERIGELTQDVICITSKGRPVKPKTIGQKQYVQAVLHSPVTIGVGPAGTGKTYLAVAAAVAFWQLRIMD